MVMGFPPYCADAPVLGRAEPMDAGRLVFSKSCGRTGDQSEMAAKISCFPIGCNDWDSLTDLLALSSHHQRIFACFPEKQLSFVGSAAK
jgi:hypothetical protein